MGLASMNQNANWEKHEDRPISARNPVNVEQLAGPEQCFDGSVCSKQCARYDNPPALVRNNSTASVATRTDTVLAAGLCRTNGGICNLQGRQNFRPNQVTANSSVSTVPLGQSEEPAAFPMPQSHGEFTASPASQDRMQNGEPNDLESYDSRPQGTVARETRSRAEQTQ